MHTDTAAPAATCVACGLPSPVDFCARPACLTFGSGATAPGPSIVNFSA